MQKRTLFFSLLLITFFIAQLNAESPPDPPIRMAQGQGVVGLDFSGSGNNEQIMIFVINVNDTPGSFKVRFEFTNACQFKCNTRIIAMTDLVWNKISGSLGTGLTEPVDKDILHHRIEGGTAYEWEPQGTGQKSETSNYILELKATWDNPTGILSGFYYETIKATVIPK